MVAKLCALFSDKEEEAFEKYVMRGVVCVYICMAALLSLAGWLA